MFFHDYFTQVFFPNRYFPGAGVSAGVLQVTLQHQTTVKSWFQAGDAPTQAQFVDFIESALPEWQIDAAIQAGGGGAGVLNIISNVSATVQTAGAFGLQVLGYGTTAALANAVVPGWALTATPAGSLEILSAVSATVHTAGDFGFHMLAAATTAAGRRKFGNVRHVADYGGFTSSAIAAAVAACSAGETLIFDQGTYSMTSTVTVDVTGLRLRGAGWKQTVLSWDSGAAASDILRIGNGVNNLVGCHIEGLRITATTAMKTPSAALHLRKVGRSYLKDICIDGQDGSQKLFHGIWFDGVDQVVCTDFEVRGAGVTANNSDGIRVNGELGATGLKAGLFLSGFKCSSFTNGIHVGGDFGGIICERFDVAQNDINLLIDENLVAAVNREAIFGLGSFDNPITGPNVHINAATNDSAWIQFDGTWIASSRSEFPVGTLVCAAASHSILFSGGRHYNNLSDAFRIHDPNALVFITGNFITNNGGIGVNVTVSAAAVSIGDNCFLANSQDVMTSSRDTNMHPIRRSTWFWPSNRPASVGAGVVFYGGGANRLYVFDGSANDFRAISAP